MASAEFLELTSSDFYILPYHHRKIKFQLADEDELQQMTKARKDSMHLSTLDGKTYHLHDHAVNRKKKTVSICHSCFVALDYSINQSNLPPLQTFKNYDVGKIPPHLPELTLVEVLSIRRALYVHTVFHLRALSSGVAQTALRGHSICLPMTALDRQTSDKTFLPREDLAGYIDVKFMGTKKIWKIAKKVAQTHAPLHVSIHKISS